MILIGPPLLQLFVFSYAATLEVTNVDVAVLNRDSGHWGQELVERIDGSPTFRSDYACCRQPESLSTRDRQRSR